MQHKIFAMELCILMRDTTLCHQLQGLVREHPARVSFAQKWEMYRRARALLLANLDLATRGCWDFFDEDHKSETDFKMWCDGLFTQEGARLTPSGSGDPATDPRYMTFTMAFLMQAGAPSVETLSELCTIPDHLLWKRETFAKLLENLGQLNFGSVKGDVVYVIPGADEWGLTAADLELAKFHYLREIV